MPLAPNLRRSRPKRQNLVHHAHKGRHAIGCHNPESRRRRFEHLDDEEMEEILANGSDTPAVQIIPSMLAQCSPRLERIEEEAEGPRRARETKARAKALGLQGLLPGSRGLMRHRFAPEDMSSEWKASIAHEVLPKTNVMSSA
ncbi:unnamed protein product [Durusdinium trenchii]|uniref:Ribosome biogenesis protein NOP53 n=1 Tax=Durusdinium trenchii TaxID=1381693 RepID=A0ABP0MXQ0_9DINO